MGWGQGEGAAQGPPLTAHSVGIQHRERETLVCRSWKKKKEFIWMLLSPHLCSPVLAGWISGGAVGKGIIPTLSFPSHAVWVGKLRHGVTSPLGPLQIMVQRRAVPKAVDKTLGTKLKPAVRPSLDSNLHDPTLSYPINSFLGIILWDRINTATPEIFGHFGAIPVSLVELFSPSSFPSPLSTA